MKSQLISKKSLAEELAERIKEQIHTGIYQVNEKLPIEPELMTTFGVGRSTVREAIRILSNSGFIRVQQGAGTFVEDPANRKKTISEKFQHADVEDLDEVRRLLEVKIAEKAALNRSEEDLEKIAFYLELRNRAALAGELEACIQADIHFHTAISVASKNEILAELYKTAAAHLKKWFLREYTDTQAFIDTQSLHTQLYRHICDRQPKLALETAEKIIRIH